MSDVCAICLERGDLWSMCDKCSVLVCAPCALEWVDSSGRAATCIQCRGRVRMSVTHVSPLSREGARMMWERLRTHPVEARKVAAAMSLRLAVASILTMRIARLGFAGTAIDVMRSATTSFLYAGGYFIAQNAIKMIRALASGKLHCTTTAAHLQRPAPPPRRSDRLAEH